MEQRTGTVSVCRAGGTAGKNARTYKLSLPSAWVSAMGVSGGRKVVLSFDGDSVTVRPEQSMEEYRNARLARGHSVLSVRYYDRDRLCTLIYADETARDLQAENVTDNAVKTAFGRNRLPSWEDFEAFLEERCVPRQRAGLREYLEALGLDAYEPLEIVRKTKGRMAEDQQWMEVETL